MEAGFIILIATVALVFGLAIGVLIGKRQAKRQYTQDTQYAQGTLNVDCSDPEFEPGLFLSLGVPVNDVISRKYVKLDVNVFKQNSQK